jgi:Holliday junction resolvase RusA-like endonuclease
MSDKLPPHPSHKQPPDIVTLSGFPMPPSVNNLYISMGRRRVKAPSYRAFERQVLQWMMLHAQELDLARKLSTMTGPQRFIHIDAVFFMHRSRILCKDGRPKKNDTANRIKALDDALAQILGIDDCYFWSGSYDKAAVDDESLVGVDVTMVISEYKESECRSRL